MLPYSGHAPQEMGDPEIHALDLLPSRKSIVQDSLILKYSDLEVKSPDGNERFYHLVLQ